MKFSIHESVWCLYHAGIVVPLRVDVQEWTKNTPFID